MQAVVLAAGKGRRLRPLTENRPKPMIPAANRPILEHIVEALVEAGVEELVLVVGANRERVQSHFQDGQDWGVDLSYVVQEPQLGTGHALRQAEAVVGEAFVAVNGDRIIDPGVVERVWERHGETGNPVMAVTRVPRPSQYGVVELDGDAVTDLQEQPHPELAESDYINAGVYAFTPAIFSAVRRTDSHGEQELTDTLTELVDSGSLRAVRYQGRWLDVSEPWDLLDVNEALVDGGPDRAASATVHESAAVDGSVRLGDDAVIHPQATVRHEVTLGGNASVGPGAVVENTIVLPDATVKAGAVVRDAIVGANATVGANTTIEGGDATVVLDDAVHRDVTFGGLVGDNATIGANVTVAPGTIVGSDAVADSGSVLSGRVEGGSHVKRG